MDKKNKEYKLNFAKRVEEGKIYLYANNGVYGYNPHQIYVKVIAVNYPISDYYPELTAEIFRDEKHKSTFKDFSYNFSDCEINKTIKQ